MVAAEDARGADARCSSGSPSSRSTRSRPPGLQSLREQASEQLEVGTPVVEILPKVPAVLLVGAPNASVIDSLLSRAWMLAVGTGAPCLIIDCGGLAEAGRAELRRAAIAASSSRPRAARSRSCCRPRAARCASAPPTLDGRARAVVPALRSLRQCRRALARARGPLIDASQLSRPSAVVGVIRLVAAVGDFPIGFGRYQLVERLAVGGMAELFVATAPGEHGFQKKVVIKRLLPHLVDDETYNAMFIDEAKLTARLVHPKIAQTFELGKVDDALFIAMEYVDGIDVLALLREFATPAPPRRAAARRVDRARGARRARLRPQPRSARTARALGIVHRDISPSNVLLSVRGDIKLVDFGIARAIDPDRAHKSKTRHAQGQVRLHVARAGDRAAARRAQRPVLGRRRARRAADRAPAVRGGQRARRAADGARREARTGSTSTAPIIEPGLVGDRAQGAQEVGRRALAERGAVPRRARRVAVRAPPPHDAASTSPTSSLELRDAVHRAPQPGRDRRRQRASTTLRAPVRDAERERRRPVDRRATSRRQHADHLGQLRRASAEPRAVSMHGPLLGAAPVAVPPRTARRRARRRPATGRVRSIACRPTAARASDRSQPPEPIRCRRCRRCALPSPRRPTACSPPSRSSASRSGRRGADRRHDQRRRRGDHAARRTIARRPPRTRRCARSTI